MKFIVKEQAIYFTSILIRVSQEYILHETLFFLAYQNAQLYNHHKPLTITAQIISYKQPYSEVSG